jgi:hypothetical protein
MAIIHLTKGKSTIVDDEDLARLSDLTWTLHNKGYAKAIVDRQTILMHRFIMQPVTGQDVDHINGNKLDNRRSNLRLCTRSENLMNRGGEVGSSSHFKGVCRHASRPGWMARITVNGKSIYLGYFKTEEDAAHAYNSAARIYHGEFARLNNLNS